MWFFDLGSQPTGQIIRSPKNIWVQSIFNDTDIGVLLGFFKQGSSQGWQMIASKIYIRTLLRRHRQNPVTLSCTPHKVRQDALKITLA
jgi:hypothetical protein